MAEVVSDGEPIPSFVRRARAASQQNTVRRADAYARALTESARTVLGRAGTGRLYRYGGGWYRASAPGNPPARRGGELSTTAHAEVGEMRERGSGWEVPVTLAFPPAYAGYLDPTLVGGEFGNESRQREIRRFVLQDAVPKFRFIQAATR